MNRTQLYYYKCIMIDIITIITCIVELLCLTQAEQSPINYNILVNPPSYKVLVCPSSHVCITMFIHTFAWCMHFASQDFRKRMVMYSIPLNLCAIFLKMTDKVANHSNGWKRQIINLNAQAEAQQHNCMS